MIVISDGIDVSRDPGSSTPAQSLDLQRAITEAQRRAVPIYSIFVPPAAAADVSVPKSSLSGKPGSRLWT